MMEAAFRSLIAVVALGAIGLVPSLPARAATVTLNPDSPGWKADLEVSGAASNWSACLSDDSDSSCVHTNHAGYESDFYNLTDAGPAGVINSVTVCIMARAADTPTQEGYRIGLRTYAATYFGEPGQLTPAFAVYSHTWAQNPTTGVGWTWEEVEALEAGVSLRRSGTTGSGKSQQGIASHCTQVWVVVDYTSSEGKSHGYWKNHPDDWPAGYAPDDRLDGFFDLSDFPALAQVTLLETLSFTGGGADLQDAAHLLLLQAVAALLNAADPDINYPLTEAQIISQVNSALGSGNRDTILGLQETLDAHNNLSEP